MEDKTYSNRENEAGAFLLWDALGLALQENRSSDLLKSLTDSFNHLSFETEYRSSDLLKSLTDSFSRLDLEIQVNALRMLGRMAAQLREGPRRGVISYFLARHLEDANEERRVAATMAVGMLIKQTLVETLAVKLGTDKSARIRMASAEMLGESPASVILHALKESLRDPSWEVRAAAVQTFGKLGEQLIIEPLRTALNDEDFSVRGAAIHALGTLKGCVSTEYLASLAQDKTNDWCTREAAVTALERAGEYVQAQPLREELNLELEAEIELDEEDMDDDLTNKKMEEIDGTTGPETPHVPGEPGKSRKLPLAGVFKRQQPGRKNRPHRLEWEERSAACVLLRLKKYGEAAVSSAQRSIVVFPSICLSTLHFLKHCGEEILSQSSKLRKRIVHVSHRLKKYGEERFSRTRGIIVVLCLLLCLIGGMADAILGGTLPYSRANNTSPRPSIATLPPVQVVSTAPQLQDSATLKATPQPGPVNPGQQTWIIITATNNGSTIWTSRGGYQLTCMTDDHREIDCMRVSMVIRSSVPQGRTYTFKVLFVAPPICGTYTLLLAMSHNNVPFGDPLRIKVHVS